MNLIDANVRGAGKSLLALPTGCQDLRAAVEDLFPRLKAGELPTPVRLGYKLRSQRGRVFDGAAIQQGFKQQGGMSWRVERSD